MSNGRSHYRVMTVECRECGDQFVRYGDDAWFYICPKCNAKRVEREKRDRDARKQAE